MITMITIGFKAVVGSKLWKKCWKSKTMRPIVLSTVGDGVFVQPSKIPKAGNGLYVSRPFKKGEYITLYDGETITRREAWSRSVLSHMATREGVTVDGLKDPIWGRGGGSFANASLLKSGANAELVAWLGLIVVRAVRPIDAWEEVLVYYGRRGFLLSCSHTKRRHDF